MHVGPRGSHMAPLSRQPLPLQATLLQPLAVIPTSTTIRPPSKPNTNSADIYQETIQSTLHIPLLKLPPSMADLMDTDAGTELFASYEAELKLVSADLSQKLDQIPDLTGEPRKAAVSQAERAVEEAKEIVRSDPPSTSIQDRDSR